MATVPYHPFPKILQIGTGHGVLENIFKWVASARKTNITNMVSWKQTNTLSRSVLEQVVGILLGVNFWYWSTWCYVLHLFLYALFLESSAPSNVWIYNMRWYYYPASLIETNALELIAFSCAISFINVFVIIWSNDQKINYLSKRDFAHEKKFIIWAASEKTPVFTNLRQCLYSDVINIKNKKKNSKIYSTKLSLGFKIITRHLMAAACIFFLSAWSGMPS